MFGIAAAAQALRFACDRDDNSATSSTAAGVGTGEGDGLPGFLALGAAAVIDQGNPERRECRRQSPRKSESHSHQPWEAEAEEGTLPLLLAPLLVDGTKRLSSEVAREDILVDVVGVSVSAYEEADAAPAAAASSLSLLPREESADQVRRRVCGCCWSVARGVRVG